MWLNGMAESRRWKGRSGRMLKCSPNVANPTQVLRGIITRNTQRFGLRLELNLRARSQAFRAWGYLGITRLGISGIR